MELRRWENQFFIAMSDCQRVTYDSLYKHISKIITIWLFNIAMENGPFIDVFPS
jgi:hypothetical protein